MWRLLIDRNMFRRFNATRSGAPAAMQGRGQAGTLGAPRPRLEGQEGTRGAPRPGQGGGLMVPEGHRATVLRIINNVCIALHIVYRLQIM